MKRGLHQKEENMTQFSKTSTLIMLGGAFSGFYNALQAADITRTCLLAALGTLVSFLLTCLLKRVFKKWMH